MRSVLACKSCAKEQTDKKMRTIHGTDISQRIVTCKYILTYRLNENYPENKY